MLAAAGMLPTHCNLVPTQRCTNSMEATKRLPAGLQKPITYPGEQQSTLCLPRMLPTSVIHDS